jgi:chromosome segregation ATPase
MMSVIKSLGLASLLCLVGFLCLLPTNVSGQTAKPAESAQSDRDQMLRQLLTEVRELRLAVQRLTVTNMRFQMLTERVKTQQAHVDALSGQLEDVHLTVANNLYAKAGMEQQKKDDEDRLDGTTELNAHTELESRIKVVKSNLARLAQEEERLRNHGAALDTELQSAQAKLNELNSRLDLLMNEWKEP